MNMHRYVVRIWTIVLLGFLCSGTVAAQSSDAEQQMTVLFNDDFSDNGNDWPEGDGEKNSLHIQDGQYWFHHKVEEGAWLTWKTIEIDQQKDFAIHTTITKVSGVENYGYGLLWGLEDVDHYYLLSLSGNGYYRYIKSDGEDSTSMIDWTQSDIILQGDGATNSIIIKKVGEQLEFWVNEQLLADAEFEPFFGNQIGYIVYNVLEVSIDNLRVEQPAPALKPVHTVQPEHVRQPDETLNVALDIQPETVSASRVALVIGNAAYNAAPLVTPLNDSHAIKRELEALGFYVLHATNLTLVEMKTAIASFLAMAPGKEMAIFYFSGYAAQRRGENFLLPAGPGIRTEDHLLYEAVSLHDVLVRMQQAGSRHPVVLLDACRENPGLWLFEKGLSAITPPPGISVAYNASPGRVVSETEGELSLFTRYLLPVLRQGELSVSQILEQAAERVKTETDGRQAPWFSSNVE